MEGNSNEAKIAVTMSRDTINHSLKLNDMNDNELLNLALKNWEETGSLSNIELRVMLKHYSTLEKLLKKHGKVYQLVWFDVFNKLETFKGFWAARNTNKIKLHFDIHGEFINNK